MGVELILRLISGLFIQSVAVSLFLPPVALAQQKQTQPPKSGGMGGIASGVISAPVYDEEKRPITAGEFVKDGPIVFEDVTAKAGLSGWIHKMGVPEKKFIVEANGSDVCLIDYDNDRWLDLYVGNYGKNRLYHNSHDGTFVDVPEKAGVTLGNWSTGSAWGDYDGDDRLDLYVTGYVHYDRASAEALARDASNSAFLYRGVSVNCGLRGLPGEPDHLFHNNRDTITTVGPILVVSRISVLIGNPDATEARLIAEESATNRRPGRAKWDITSLAKSILFMRATDPTTPAAMAKSAASNIAKM